MDTDGSVSRRGKQFCVQFGSNNLLLLKQVNSIGKEWGIFTYISSNETGTNKWENVIKYFRIVGSSNLKHVIRFHLKYNENKTIYVKELQKYLKKDLYTNLNLPYKMGPWSSG